MILVQGKAFYSCQMEERKRPASHDPDGSEPPFKRQITAINGTSKTHVDADMPWKDDLEVHEPYPLQ